MAAAAETVRVVEAAAAGLGDGGPGAALVDRDGATDAARLGVLITIVDA